MSTPETSPRRRTRVERGIYKTPTGSYEIGWTDSTGKQRWKIVKGGISAARRALAEEHARRGRGEASAADPRLTFQKAHDAWWATHAQRLKPKTRKTYRSALDQHLLPRWGRSRLSAITAAEVAAFIAAQERAGFKGWSVRGQLTALSGIFKFASRHLGYPGTNPVSLLDRLERPKHDERPKRILTPAELDRLLAAVAEPYRLAFELAAETGARLGEVLGLVWADVDTEAQTLRFDQQLSSARQREPLKTARSRRTIEITADLSVRLAAERLARHPGASGPGELVFVSRRGTPHDHRNIGGRVLAAAVKRAGLDAPAPTFHDLRHTHASRLIAAGMDVQSVADRLGHANISVTQSTYAHEFDAAARSPERRAMLEAIYGNGGIRQAVPSA